MGQNISASSPLAEKERDGTSLAPGLAWLSREPYQNLSRRCSAAVGRRSTVRKGSELGDQDDRRLVGAVVTINYADTSQSKETNEGEEASIEVRSYALVGRNMIEGWVLDDLSSVLKFLVRAVKSIHCIWRKTKGFADETDEFIGKSFDFLQIL
jgi:hypothetical protein